MCIRDRDIPRASDKGAGFPEPLSDADESLTPTRYKVHVKQKQRGIDLLGPIQDRYQPANGRTDRTDKAKDKDRVKAQKDARKDARDADTSSAGDVTVEATPTSPDPSAPPGG